MEREIQENSGTSCEGTLGKCLYVQIRAVPLVHGFWYWAIVRVFLYRNPAGPGWLLLLLLLLGSRSCGWRLHNASQMRRTLQSPLGYRWILVSAQSAEIRVRLDEGKRTARFRRDWSRPLPSSNVHVRNLSAHVGEKPPLNRNFSALLHVSILQKLILRSRVESTTRLGLHVQR